MLVTLGSKRVKYMFLTFESRDKQNCQSAHKESGLRMLGAL